MNYHTVPPRIRALALTTIVATTLGESCPRPFQMLGFYDIMTLFPRSIQGDENELALSIKCVAANPAALGSLPYTVAPWCFFAAEKEDQDGPITGYGKHTFGNIVDVVGRRNGELEWQFRAWTTSYTYASVLALPAGLHT